MRFIHIGLNLKDKGGKALDQTDPLCCRLAV